MPTPFPRRGLRIASCALLGATCAAACIDLFHDTDFVTACGVDCDAHDAAVDDVTDAAPAPPPPLCTDDAETAASRAAHACGWLDTCEGRFDTEGLGTCVIEALAAYDCTVRPDLLARGRPAALWRCLAEVRTCTEVERCLYGEPAPSCEAVLGSFTTCANPDVRVRCASSTRSPPTATEPCLLTGRSCTKIDTSVGECGGIRGTACPDIGASTCAGTNVVACSLETFGQLDRGLDCDGFGAGACIVTPFGASCRPSTTAPGCGEATAVTCTDAGTAQVCVANAQVRVECPRLGLRCDPSRVPIWNVLGACRSDPSACAPATPTCQDGRLVSCARGRTFVIDCEAEGLRPCRQTTGGLAQCQAPQP